MTYSMPRRGGEPPRVRSFGKAMSDSEREFRVHPPCVICGKPVMGRLVRASVLAVTRAWHGECVIRETPRERA